MLQGIVFSFLILYPFWVAWKGWQNRNRTLKSKVPHYVKNTVFPLVLLLGLYLINPKMFASLNFDQIGRGVIVPDTIMFAVFPIFLMPLVISLLPWNQSDNGQNAKESFGLPVGFHPSNIKELVFFSIYIATGVVFEELITKQLSFYSFYHVLAFKGDLLLIFTAILFAICHVYQGWKGVLLSLIMALILGKIFQLKGSILLPIALHLFFNLTIVALALKRIRKTQKEKTLVS